MKGLYKNENKLSYEKLRIFPIKKILEIIWNQMSSDILESGLILHMIKRRHKDQNTHDSCSYPWYRTKSKMQHIIWDFETWQYISKDKINLKYENIIFFILFGASICIQYTLQKYT